MVSPLQTNHPYVFISHSSTDLDITIRISRDLLAQGYEIWLDDWHIVGDKPYWDEIQESIQGCAVFLYLLSQRSAQPGNGARKELMHVTGLKQRQPLIVPIMVEDVAYEQIPIVITAGEYQIHDFVNRSYEDAFRRTLNAIAKAFNNPASVRQSSTSEWAIVKPKTRSVYISYLRNLETDRSLAIELAKTLRDRKYTVYSELSEGNLCEALPIEEAAKRSQVFVILLSPQSVSSHTVIEQLQNLQMVLHETQASIEIVPVRVGNAQTFPYHLEFLNKLPWLIWDAPTDTLNVVDQIESATKGKEWGLRTTLAKAAVIATQQNAAKSFITIPQPYADPGVSIPYLEQPTGTVNPDSRFYIERKGDSVLAGQLRNPNTTLVIRAARQMGKSSLLKRAKRLAESMDKTCGVIDFQGLFDRKVLQDDTLFFQRFSTLVARAFKLQKVVPSPEEVWEPMLGNVMCCTDYMEQYILPALEGQSLLLAIDEVDRVLGSDFRSDFFGMLRHWHNNRADDGSWANLSLALVVSTEPRLLIEDVNQSPFNVGVPIMLEDFTKSQVDDLNERHNHAFEMDTLDELFHWIGGHPYLVRQAMYLVASQEYEPEGLFQAMTTSESPFVDHLNHYLNYFYERPLLAQAMMSVIKGQSGPTRDTLLRLQSAGLIRQEGKSVVPRCRLYAEYFSQHPELYEGSI